MKAKYQGRCSYCSESIEVGDEIRRGNGPASGVCRAFFAHERCVPASSRLQRARFAAVVIKADEHGWIPVGSRAQYVHRKAAEGTAATWNCLGATAEVQELD